MGVECWDFVEFGIGEFLSFLSSGMDVCRQDAAMRPFLDFFSIACVDGEILNGLEARQEARQGETSFT